MNRIIDGRVDSKRFNIKKQKGIIQINLIEGSLNCLNQIVVLDQNKLKYENWKVKDIVIVIIQTKLTWLIEKQVRK